jgi:hypothetical protein
MDDKSKELAHDENKKKISQVKYNSEKDFYKGMKGELRLKAEGLFKKAKEKGISIEEVTVETMKESQIEIPGLGLVELPAYFVKVTGRNLESGQVMVDGKMIDFNNRFKKYIAENIENKNIVKDEKGRKISEGGKYKFRDPKDLSTSSWELFEIGRNLIDDKEFGIEKTITGACDRIIRKLMGENDWVFPEEARLLDEEFNSVQRRIFEEKEKDVLKGVGEKKATDRQVNYFKARVKNAGLDPENSLVIGRILKMAGLASKDFSNLTTSDLSRLIDSVSGIVPKVKDELEKKLIITSESSPNLIVEEGDFKQ